jgi:hypothetical protein
MMLLSGHNEITALVCLGHVCVIDRRESESSESSPHGMMIEIGKVIRKSSSKG